MLGNTVIHGNTSFLKNPLSLADGGFFVYTRDMTEHRVIKAYQDLDGFILLENTESGSRQIASTVHPSYPYAVVGIKEDGEYFITPCKGTRDASFAEVSAREDGCTEVQTLSIKDVR